MPQAIARGRSGDRAIGRGARTRPRDVTRRRHGRDGHTRRHGRHGRLDVESMGNPSTGVTARARDRRRARWRSRCRAYDDDASTTTTWDTFSRKTTIKGKTTRSARAIALSRVRVRTSRAIDRGQAPSSVCLRIENYPHARDLASRRTTREISRATVGDDGGGGGAKGLEATGDVARVREGNVSDVYMESRWNMNQARSHEQK